MVYLEVYFLYLEVHFLYLEIDRLYEEIEEIHLHVSAVHFGVHFFLYALRSLPRPLSLSRSARGCCIPIDQSAAALFLIFLYRREDPVDIIPVSCGVGRSVCAHLFDNGVIFHDQQC